MANTSEVSTVSDKLAVQQEEAAQAPADESDNDDAVTDVKLSLNELKFGRNYGSEN